MTSTDPQRPEGVAIVTGAASGMGAATARLMAAEGWPLLLCDVNGNGLAALAATLQAGQISTCAGDIADPQFAPQLVSQLGVQPVAALVHCAGLSPAMADPARILAVNLAGTMRLLDAVQHRMSAGAAAVLISSNSGNMLARPDLDNVLDRLLSPGDVETVVAHGPNSQVAYAISKRGIQRLVKREAFAWGRRGARLVSISPGVIDTTMIDLEIAVDPRIEDLVELAPIARKGTAEEIARVAVFLCSPAASFITGIDIPVDGGAMSIFEPGGGIGSNIVHGVAEAD